MTSETLAPDIGWEPSGHLSEIALTALADGEEALLDATMHEHLGTCDACAARLGEAAMRSAHVADAFTHLGALAPTLVQERTPAKVIAAAPVIALPATALPVSVTSSSSRPPRRKVPVAPIAAALVVAMLGAAPSVLSLPAEVAQTASVLRKLLPSFVRLLPQALDRLWSGPGGSAALLVWTLSLALVAVGLGIARKASKKMIVDGGRR